MADFSHIPVLPEEVVRYLAPRSGGIYLDGTLGGGGHASLLLRSSSPDGILLGFDRDQEALAAARERLSIFGDRARLFHGNFNSAAARAAEAGLPEIDGFLLDLGVSSYQLDSAERGFSFREDAPLDMRMDREGGETAADLVNTLPEEDLVTIIKEYGEERWASRIASFIVKAREESPVETTLQLADIVKGAIPKAKWEERIHPATRTFQALRIAVNQELESLSTGLSALFGMLRPGGRGVVISFHSLEDRIVKNTFRDLATGCICVKQVPVCVCGQKPRARVLTSRPVMAGEGETVANPRARSAKLRAVEKL